MIDYTFVCVFNNASILNAFTKQSLKNMDGDFDIILIDNTDNKYESMSAAYNSIIGSIQTKWVFFLHQDINVGKDFLQRFETMICMIENKKVGVIGVAGCKQSDSCIYSNIRYGPNLVMAGKERVDKPVEVQTLDECLFAIKYDVLKQYPFDEIVCNNWHLYCVDRCLELIRNSYHNYVIGMDLEHHSKKVSMNKEYFITLKRVMKKYENQFSNINTTCGNWEYKRRRRIMWLLFKERIKEVLK